MYRSLVVILAEQSLRSLGGHHFEYATEILGAAEQAGMDMLLVGDSLGMCVASSVNASGICLAAGRVHHSLLGGIG